MCLGRTDKEIWLDQVAAAIDLRPPHRRVDQHHRDANACQAQQGHIKVDAKGNEQQCALSWRNALRLKKRADSARLFV